MAAVMGEVRSVRRADEARGACRWSLIAAAVARGHGMQVELRGRCMWPALRPGDRLLVRAVISPRVGDVVICSDGARAHAHRVVDLGHDVDGEPFVRCRGDVSLLLDAPVLVRDLVGVVEHIERDGRTRRIARSISVVSRVLAHLCPLLSRARDRWRAQAA